MSSQTQAQTSLDSTGSHVDLCCYCFYWPLNLISRPSNVFPKYSMLVCTVGLLREVGWAHTGGGRRADLCCPADTVGGDAFCHFTSRSRSVTQERALLCLSPYLSPSLSLSLHLSFYPSLTISQSLSLFSYMTCDNPCSVLIQWSKLTDLLILNQ